MAHELTLLIGRTSVTSAWPTSLEGPNFVVAFSKSPSLGELMLFDATCLRAIEDNSEPDKSGRVTREPISDRESAVERFRRRLPLVCAALRWHPSACRTLEAFGRFFAAIDWPYIRYDTSDYRLVLTPEEERSFDDGFALALSALDCAAIAKEGELFGGTGGYSREWEELLDFGFRPWSASNAFVTSQAIYSGDPRAYECVATGTPDYHPNEWARLLATYLKGTSA